MKKIIFGILLLSIGISTNAQPEPNFEWAKSMGGTGYENGISITTDANRNVYTVGNFELLVDFDPGQGVNYLSPVGDNDVFIQKLDASGNFQWVKRLGGAGYDIGKSIISDINGDLYVTGIFEGTALFGSVNGTIPLTSNGESDLFIQKLDSSGNFLWVKSFGTVYNDGSNSITTDTSGNIYVSGAINTGIVDFDPGPDTLNLTGPGSFVLKLDSLGNFLWVKGGSTGHAGGKSITNDVSGNVYATGSFANTVDFDPGAGTFNLTSAGSNDIFIQKLDINGNFEWVKSVGGAEPEYSYSIAADDEGNVYVTGYFEGTVDFDPGPNTAFATSYEWTMDDPTDIFLLKLDATGNFVWCRRYGSYFNDYGNSITLDNMGNLYTTGKCDAQLFGGGGDICLQNFDTNGNLIWAASMGGGGVQVGVSIAAIDGIVYTTGNFGYTVDFDPGSGSFPLTSVGGQDVFISKLCSNPSGTDVISACISYTWIDGNTYTSSNNTATHTLSNAGGCDSVVTLDLTIVAFTATVSVSGNTLTAQPSGGSYQWLDCDGGYALIAGETNNNYTPTSSGNYAVAIDYGVCKDTSDCESVTLVGLQENKQSELHLLPNPTTGILTIEGAEGIASIYDIYGRMVLSANTNTLDISKAAMGIYFVRVLDEQGKVYVAKVVKE